MPEVTSVFNVFKFLWFRCMALGAISLLFCEALSLAQGQAQGWTFYLTGLEVGFEVAVRLIAASLLGLIVGTAYALLLTMVVYAARSFRQHLAKKSIEISTFIVIVLISVYVLGILTRSVHFLEVR